MVSRDSWILPGSGVLSGLTLDAGKPDLDDPNAEYDSPWAQVVHEMWAKQSRGTPDSSGYAAPDQWSIPGSGPWASPEHFSTGSPTKRTSEHTGWPQQFGLRADDSPFSPDVLLASYLDRTARPWLEPVSPVDAFNPWVRNAIDSIRKAITHSRQGGGSGASASDSPECQEEWKEARADCAKELAKPNPSRGITGGYNNVEDCARGLVSEKCGGNFRERPKEPRTRPYTPR